jgi:hypothetical protein
MCVACSYITLITRLLYIIFGCNSLFIFVGLFMIIDGLVSKGISPVGLFYHPHVILRLVRLPNHPLTLSLTFIRNGYLSHN